MALLDQFGKPITLSQHNSIEHAIGEEIPAPTLIKSLGISSIGSSSVPAREDHSHGGGFLVVPSNTARNALAPTSNDEGVTAYVQDQDTLYMWTGSAWVIWVTPVYQAYRTYTPILGNWGTGNATFMGRYRVDGTTVTFACGVTLGSTSTPTAGNPTLSLPPGYDAINDGGATGIGNRQTQHVVCGDATGGQHHGSSQCSVNSTIPLVWVVSGTTLVDNNISSGVPFAWTTNDFLRIGGWYERVVS